VSSAKRPAIGLLLLAIAGIDLRSRHALSSRCCILVTRSLLAGDKVIRLGRKGNGRVFQHQT
jgi:hypothetical protein